MNCKKLTEKYENDNQSRDTDTEESRQQTESNQGDRSADQKQIFSGRTETEITYKMEMKNWTERVEKGFIKILDRFVRAPIFVSLPEIKNQK